ncbi:chloroplastic import inner membrane translocase subunit HP30-2-like [Papaver somniferum]|uniref:chloroplastic import inner membrane translocase subunit HP30-2-like n=1 Tax=Papaver somniferum TaxID=3469 RepID=UPI000E6F4BC7|nr:chloroplastic import inner membrane translocase subunit HP30-2-like [Papaver somniferum]
MEGEGGAVPVVMTPTATNDNITEQRLNRIVDLIVLPLETALYATTYARLVSPRSFAVLEAVDRGMICALKGIREKDDTKARFYFRIHVLLGWEQLNKPSPRRVQLEWGSCLRSVQSRSEPPAVEDTRYTRTRCMLSELGLQGYEKHFKKHLLMDETMPLLNESDLEKAGIPLGARKLILNHIER